MWKIMKKFNKRSLDHKEKGIKKGKGKKRGKKEEIR